MKPKSIRRFNFRNQKSKIKQVVQRYRQNSSSEFNPMAQTSGSLFFSTFRTEDYIATQDFFPAFERSFGGNDLGQFGLKKTKSFKNTKKFEFRNKKETIRRVLAKKGLSTASTQTVKAKKQPKCKKFCFRNSSEILRKYKGRGKKISQTQVSF